MGDFDGERTVELIRIKVTNISNEIIIVLVDEELSVGVAVCDMKIWIVFRRTGERVEHGGILWGALRKEAASERVELSFKS